MVGAGLLARNAVAKGLTVSPVVKTSLAPGLEGRHRLPRAGRAHGPARHARLRARRATAARRASATPGRSTSRSPPRSRRTSWSSRPCCRATATSRAGSIPSSGRRYLASPPLVVAFALAGRVDIDLTTEPLGTAADGTPVMLADIWPVPDRDPRGDRRLGGRGAVPGDVRVRVRGRRPLARAADPRRATATRGTRRSTYIANPPFFEGLTAEPAPLRDIEGARVLAVLGDSVTTDHISPAGSIAAWSPAGAWLQAHGVSPARLQLVRRPARPPRGDDARHVRQHPAAQPRWSTARRGRTRSTCPTASRCSSTTPRCATATRACRCSILAGKEYGSGSSRDWAAKGTALLGVRAVIAETYERIHRSNLVGMGVLPLQFLDGAERGVARAHGPRVVHDHRASRTSSRARS